MSKTGKTILIIIIAIIVIAVIWYVSAKQGAIPAMQSEMASSSSMSGMDMGASSTPAVTASSSVSSDLQSIDAQMSGLDQDDAAVDQGVASSSPQ